MQNDQIAFKLGVIQVALANSFISFNIICNKYLIRNVPVSILLELRYAFGSIILLIFCLFSKNKFKFYLSNKQYSNYQKFIYILMALSGGAVFNAIYMLGMHNTSAISTGIITSTIPILIVFFSFIFLKQKIRAHHIISALFVTLGIFILNIGANSIQSIHEINSLSANFANFIVFLGMIPEALFTIFAKMLNVKISAITSALLINFINCAVCLPFCLYSLGKAHSFSIDGEIIFLSFLIGLFNGALFYIFYNKGIIKINAPTAGLLTGVIPISTTILSIIFLGETFSLLSFIGMFFVLVSIYIGVRPFSTKVVS